MAAAMQKLLVCVALAAASVGAVRGATLQQLSLDDMIRQSTAIVRGKTQLTYSAFRGPLIYTHYTLQVTETLKGTAAKQLDLVVPGGVSNGLRQSLAGAPTLVNGQDYVLFLWTSKSGLTQVIGLSQGLFRVTTNSSGQFVVLRAASTEPMLNATGQPVTDSAFEMLLSDLRTRIQTVLSGGSQ
jgi:hypothetical protein